MKKTNLFVVALALACSCTLSQAEITGVSVQAGSPTSGSSFSPPTAKVPATGVRAGVVLFSVGPGPSANDIVYSWQ